MNEEEKIEKECYEKVSTVFNAFRSQIVDLMDDYGADLVIDCLDEANIRALPCNGMRC